MTACQTTPENNPELIDDTVQALNQAAKPFNSVLALPDFETDPEVMEQNMEMTIAHAIQHWTKLLHWGQLTTFSKHHSSSG
jgi:hypothetical protein